MTVGEPQWKYCSTPLGRPAASKISVTRSAMVGVWGDGFRMTVLPARMAGTRELTRVRYGYYSETRNGG
jgi:hypothetical protein